MIKGIYYTFLQEINKENVIVPKEDSYSLCCANNRLTIEYYILCLGNVLSAKLNNLKKNMKLAPRYVKIKD